MTHIGIDIEQFVTDPYGSGIQRVLQQLALNWPTDRCAADFVVPWQNHHLLLTPDQAGALMSLAFAGVPNGDLRAAVELEIARLAESSPMVSTGQLLSMYSAWLLPEVSYLPSVLRRFELFHAVMPTAMIGYDTLPMTEPANYRFVPGQAGWVSEYFRMLTTTDSVICISAYARDSIMNRLRRDDSLPISVAHPGGDHVDIPQVDAVDALRAKPVVRFLRVGTMEARKLPMELTEAFYAARRAGAKAELHFIGRPSSSESAINAHVERAIADHTGVSWTKSADDASVLAHMHDADVFISVGIEGFGIPVLESLRLGTPVLFGGVQPAGELMAGHGAFNIDEPTPENLANMFVQFSKPDAIASLKRQIDPERVPTWFDFSSSVADGVMTVFDPW